MKILHTVEQYYPSRGGMQEVVKRLSEILVEMGHEVTVATKKSSKRKSTKLGGVNIKEFEIEGNYAQGIEGEVGSYRKFVSEGKFDVITNFAAQQWATDALLPILDDIKAKKVFVPTGFSAFYNPKYKKYFEKMKTWVKQYDINVFLSDDYRDINFARKISLSEKKIKVIPNGASKKEFEKTYKSNIRKKLNIPNNHLLILHVGSHTGLKGHKEALEIFERSRIDNVTFLIIANSFGGGCKNYCLMKLIANKFSLKNKKHSRQLIIRELKRYETVEAYKEADLFLFPSNIECSPIVLFEAMASKTAFLTTDVGNAKEIIKWSNGGVVLPTTKDKQGFSKADIGKSVQVLEDLFNDKKKIRKLSKSGYEAWGKRFTWEKIAKEYEIMYKDLLSG